MNPTLTSEEKTMAAFSHASIILVFIGPILPLLMWMSMRKKSRFVAFQSLQALTYQIIVLWLALLVVLLGIILSTALLYAINAAMGDQGFSPDSLVGILEILVTAILFIVIGLLSIPGFMGAYACGKSQNYYYPLFGRKLEIYLNPDSENAETLSERREEQLVASACHSTVLIQFWGLFTPALALYSLKEKSSFLRYQATQALWLQIAALIFSTASFLGLVILSIVGAVGLDAYIRSTGTGESDALAAGLIFALVILIYLILVLLIFPIFHLYAFVASLRVVQGKDYQYPILGKLIAKKINP